MNDIFTILLLAFGLFVIAFLVYGYRLPAHWKVVESITIRGDREMIYDYLTQIENWEKWTIWSKEVNPTFEFKYEGAKSGPGATQCWKAKNQFGKTKICGCERPCEINYMFYFGQGHHQVEGCIELKPRGAETEVCWSAFGDAGNNPARRIMAKMMMSFMQKDFERGLQRLKSILEERSSAA
jgi:hypothetical protein